ncbi:MAG: recombination protein RecR [Planctomycetes bacterium]|nr:recombination protein RecR [Planctomycetota bacterium]
MALPPSLARLIAALKELPGVGTRTAERLAFHLLRAPDDQARELAQALLAMREAVVACSCCNTIAEADPCPVCADPARDRSRLLVVEQPRDVTAFEEAGWKGQYHVLHGHLNALEGIEPGHLTIDGLLARLRDGGVEEVVIATNPDYEGDTTALHVRQRLAGLPVAVTRIARGIASGSAIEYSNAAMLADALSGRARMEASA